MKTGRGFSLVFFMFTWMNMLVAEPQKPEAKAAPKTQAEPPLLFFAPVDYEPWVLVDAKGKVTGGILYEMAHTIGDFVGLPVKVEAMPFPRFESLIAEQNFDFTFVNQHQVLPGGTRFPKMVIETQLGLIYLKKNTAFSDCKKIKSVAHTSQNSDALRAIIQQQCGQVTVVNTNNLGQRVKMLGFGRVDSFLGSNEEMDLVGWFGESCDALAFVKFFDMQWHIFATANSRLTREPYRSRVERFITAYEPELYHKIRKKVLGNRYCHLPRKT
ncbi:MAG TPA: hypothetical protein VFO10_07220 [Oligoflexus sp.]|uniref:hypothetical protein n=1 Tax=Oligoflexus sp. TaxID=1971216 RepID=UPI002D811075|nr:hypothetical protein [Oligoflexus sp.]HET9237022.1 hypothetical protein [Oligoflexus sp.]